jgi:hypothetical protein
LAIIVAAAGLATIEFSRKSRFDRPNQICCHWLAG